MVLNLKEIRRNLFEQLDSVSSPLDLAIFQRELCNAIFQAEGLKANTNNKIEKSNFGLHIRMCRSYGDAMVWNLLDSHSIRQMKVHDIPPPHLSGMKEVVNKYLELIEITAEKGGLAIIPDLTNIVQVGDVILVHDSQVPMILEIKGDKIITTLFNESENDSISINAKKVTGRLQKQLEKNRTITEYLINDEKEVDNGNFLLKAISGNSELEHYWDKVDSVVREALEANNSTCIVSEGNIIWATTEEPEDFILPKDISDVFNSDSIIRIGNQLTPLEEANPYIKTPFNWEVSKEVRFALMEGDVVLTNFVDISKLVGLTIENATILDVGISGPEFDDEMISVEVESELVKYSPVVLYRMVNGFITLESIGKFILNAAIDSHRIIKDLDGRA
ncbi:MAG: hypothetical protein MK198_06780 [Gracilimonas sp.]|uniref:hypothetical protein n=1 Tax=Gracilimonas sp. TaxID=1974203 RepID=UPI0037512B00|nr:hypothetical protein [Gracilimonas sp.]